MDFDPKKHTKNMSLLDVVRQRLQEIAPQEPEQKQKQAEPLQLDLFSLDTKDK